MSNLIDILVLKKRYRDLRGRTARGRYASDTTWLKREILRMANLDTQSRRGSSNAECIRFVALHGARIINLRHLSSRAWLTPSERRQKVLVETVQEYACNHRRLTKQAQNNMLRWKKRYRPTDAGIYVFVVNQDWGECTRRLTEQYGATFAVLNMANAIHFGGHYTAGAAAQEENMFRRTNCHFCDYRLDNRLVKCIDSNAIYSPDYRSLIRGEVNGGCYLDMEPRVCFRGPELKTEDNLGYRRMSSHEVFPFYEMRCAARDQNNNPNRSKKKNLAEIRRKVGSQFEALRKAGVQHVVLGAFGCGMFANDPRVVAKAYTSALSEPQNAKFFKVVAFAVLDSGRLPNFIPFFKELST